jgi:Tol biopolymer transport system component/tRNA A-37 threonylcarbamoyl transferase component Bud32
MLLIVGEKLGPYEILAPIGAGGMGEVYRSRDTRLRRIVAIKVARETFSERFEREARAVAALNNPHICQIYDIGPNYLVMELVEGGTLAEKLSSGPIPLAEALHIARQILEALEAAHEKGIVHRDLKPANIKITPDGVVKVLDFGLAKIIERPKSPDNSTVLDSETLTMEAATQAGVVMGTAAYMAPEQARGEAVDKRADIWSFGVVLYELVTGRLLFKGKTLTDTLAAVLTVEPDWSRVPGEVLPLLRRCLAKDPKRRLRDIADAGAFLEGTQEGVLAHTKPTRSWIAWSVAALASLIAVIAMVPWIARLREGSPPADVVRFGIPIPEKTSFAPHGDFALSPDGRQLVFAASGADNVVRLWLRPLNSEEPRALPGTEDGAFPFWSPNSRFIAFSAAGKLKTIDTTGGTVKTICDIPDPFRFLGVSGIAWGGSWNQDGVIIFGTARLMRVSEDGGMPSPLTVSDSSRQEVVHAFPWFLPDGRHFLYVRASNTTGNTAVYVGSLDAKPEEQSSKPLLAGSTGGAAYVTRSDTGKGQILFLRGGTLWAQPFDAGRLEFKGDPVPVAEAVGSVGDAPRYGYGLFAASATGLLVYRPDINQHLQLTWFDRPGNQSGTVGEPGRISFPRISPDGTRVAVTKSSAGGGRDIWIYDTAKGGATKLTFSGSNSSHVWSPDASSIAYLSNYPGKYRIYRKASSGAGSEQLLFESPEPAVSDVAVLDWSTNGFVLFQRDDAKGKEALWLVGANGDGKLVPLPHSPDGEEFGGRISKDARWSGYVSNETGKLEVYVQPFNPAVAAHGTPAEQYQVSNGAFGLLGWRKDGRELLILDPDRGIVSVDLTPGPVFQPGPPKLLFRVPRTNGSATPWIWADATEDGMRILYAMPAATDAQFEAMLNWPGALKK